MDIQEYKCAGYTEVSANIPQALIDRCEREVEMAYIAPLAGEYDKSNCEVKAAIMCLSVVRMLMVSIFATRSGAKEKNAAESYTAQRGEVLRQYAQVADMYLRKLAGKDTIIEDVVKDICGIYYLSNYVKN